MKKYFACIRFIFNSLSPSLGGDTTPKLILPGFSIHYKNYPAGTIIGRIIYL
jgi:hypothetical protein